VHGALSAVPSNRYLGEYTPVLYCIAKANEFSKHGFAPPVVARLSNLSVPNDRPLYLQLEIVGHFSNVWVPLNRRVGFRVAVQWGAMIAAPKRHIHDHRHGDDSEGGLYWPGDGPR
jgi:hypothetical protein